MPSCTFRLEPPRRLRAQSMLPRSRRLARRDHAGPGSSLGSRYDALQLPGDEEPPPWAGRRRGSRPLARRDPLGLCDAALDDGWGETKLRAPPPNLVNASLRRQRPAVNRKRHQQRPLWEEILRFASAVSSTNGVEGGISSCFEHCAINSVHVLPSRIPTRATRPEHGRTLSQ